MSEPQDQLQERKIYTFGYGSLANSKSRESTDEGWGDQQEVYARATGIERGWIWRIYPLGGEPGVPTTPGKDTWGGDGATFVTYVGVDKKEGATTNGVLVEADEDIREKLAKREGAGSGYLQLDPKDMEVLADGFELPEGAEIYCAAPAMKRKPRELWPISQTYVRTILLGLRNVGGEEAAREFIRTTTMWDEVKKGGRWVDDRETPLWDRQGEEPSAEDDAWVEQMLDEELPGLREFRIPLDEWRKEYYTEARQEYVQAMQERNVETGWGEFEEGVRARRK